jgi:hypothetical protein
MIRGNEKALTTLIASLLVLIGGKELLDETQLEQLAPILSALAIAAVTWLTGNSQKADPPARIPPAFGLPPEEK